MTAKEALIKSLLEGRVLNVSNCFREIGLTNIGREIPRMIELPFGVIVSRTPKVGKNRYGTQVSYTNYRLNTTEFNQPGIEKMKEFLSEKRILGDSNNGRWDPKSKSNEIQEQKKLF